MRILVTAGPTREYFDTVRFISNPSSGKMGFATATAALQRGHQVVLVSGPVALPQPKGAELIDVVSADEMFEAASAAFESCDAAILTAAVCDYKPARKLDHKLKKRATPRPITLQPTRDIATHLGEIKGHRVIIGFAMEDRDARRNAAQKLRRKRCDAIVLNGMLNVAGDVATIEMLTADGNWSRPYQGPKVQLAFVIIDLLERLAGPRT
ncbi:MAG: phosphopantothenoylcysteine decarboxylase [Planctomycetes bacterium]|nr:phosphopantothenoylcysteine decarboxylase [Planctomycetota bacterium]